MIGTPGADCSEIRPLILNGLPAEWCVSHQVLPPGLVRRRDQCRFECASAWLLMDLRVTHGVRTQALYQEFLSEIWCQPDSAYTILVWDRVHREGEQRMP